MNYNWCSLHYIAYLVHSAATTEWSTTDVSYIILSTFSFRTSSSSFSSSFDTFSSDYRINYNWCSVQPLAFTVFRVSFRVFRVSLSVFRESLRVFRVLFRVFRVWFNFNLQCQSHWSLFNGTWQKRLRELDHWLNFEIEEITLQMQ